MSIKTRTCYEVVCDACRAKYAEEQDDGWRVFFSVEEAEDSAESSDWGIADGKHTCAECRDKEEDQP